MEQILQNKEAVEIAELITFRLDNALYGIDILNVQEINKLKNWTSVPHSQDFVLGILSLRGSIVTVINLGKRLGLNQTATTDDSRNIIVNSAGQCAGFLVDSIADVTAVDSEQIYPSPANINGVQGRFFRGVLKTEKDLIAILDIDEVLKDTELNSQN